MRMLTAGLLLLTSGAGAQKIKTHRFTDPKPAASSYNLTLHLASSEMTRHGGVTFLHVQGQLDGVAVDLESEPAEAPMGLLAPGDYRARLTGENLHKDGTKEREYDLLLLNGKHMYFLLAGVAVPGQPQ